MPIIEFGPGLTNNFNREVWRGNTSGLQNVTTASLIPILPYYFQRNSNTTTSTIRIYKGAVPTTTTELTAYTTRDSDVLISFSSSGTTGVTNTSVDPNSNFQNNPIIITTTFVSASASGTATWFRIATDPRATTPLVNVYNIIGTIGGPGSGADLQMNSTSIVSGNYYRVNNLRIQLPYTFNVL